MSAKPFSRSVTGLIVGRQNGFSWFSEFELVLEVVLVVHFELEPELLASSSRLRWRSGLLIPKRVALKGRPDTSMQQNKIHEDRLDDQYVI